MPAKDEYRDRASAEVAVLDALVDRSEDGMTVLELRSRVDADIDELEQALGSLKDDGLVSANEDGARTLITVHDRVVPEGPPTEDASVVERLRERFGF